MVEEWTWTAEDSWSIDTRSLAATQLSEVKGLGQECDQQVRDGVSIEHDQGTEG